MRTIGELAKAAEEALALVTSQPAVVEAEVFAAANSALLTRLNYTSHIPCNGVEEPKSTDSYGIGIQAVFDAPDGRRIGFGSEPSDLTSAGAERALAKARNAAVADPEFVSLPARSASPRRRAGRSRVAPSARSQPRVGWPGSRRMTTRSDGWASSSAGT